MEKRLFYRLGRALDRPVLEYLFWFIVLPTRFHYWIEKQKRVKTPF